MRKKIIRVSSSSKGVSISPAFLETLKLDLGDKIDMKIDGNELKIKKVSDNEDPKTDKLGI
jgi:antitoxin component of MazEF toxin-antitoxin module